MSFVKQNCLVLILNFMCMFFYLWNLQVCFVGLKILCCVSFSLYVVYGSHVWCFFGLVSCMCFQIFMGCLRCLLCVLFISFGSFVLHLHIFISYFPLFVVDVLCFQFVVVNALSLGMWVKGVEHHGTKEELSKSLNRQKILFLMIHN